MKHRLSKVLMNAVIAPLLCCAAAASSCVPTDLDQENSVPAVAVQKANYAIAAVTDATYQTKDPVCVAANMRYLGLAHVQKAVPALVALLGYKIAPQTFRKPLNSDIYSAISALRNMGQPAAPALIEVLASKDNNSVESMNALDTFMDLDVHRESLDRALRTLKQASEKETDPARAARLQQAVQVARRKWCKFSSCTE